MRQNLPNLSSLISRSAWLAPLVAVALCLASCSAKHTAYSDFCQIPESGWQATAPIHLTPTCDDSTGTYRIELAIRHNDRYPYGDLNLIVDLIDSRGRMVRKRVDFAITDAFGNWQGAGFGSYYQCSTVLATGVRPGQVSHMVVWMGVKGCKTLRGLTDVGIIVTRE